MKKTEHFLEQVNFGLLKFFFKTINKKGKDHMYPNLSQELHCTVEGMCVEGRKINLMF